MYKKLPVGVSDFKEIVSQNYYYVDKSLFIKEVIKHNAKVLLIPRPRRFGKTLNLSMLKYFFDIKNKDKNKKLFENLRINDENDVMKNFGKHPVIHISFKDVKHGDYYSAMEKIKSLIAQEYLRHDYLLKSNQLNDISKNKFRKIASEELEIVHYEDALKSLSNYLYNYYNQRAIILIDEYDLVIESAFVNGYYDRVIEFFRNFLSGGLKDNIYLEKGIITGILKVAKESIFSGLNNIEVCTLFDEDFNNSFGLKDEEVNNLMNYYDIDLSNDAISYWYNGYNFGGNKVYNPYSIISLVNKKGDIKPYWYFTSSNDLIVELTQKADVNIREKIYQLINGEEIIERINENIVYEDVYEDVSNIWSFLLFSGYLVWNEKINDSKISFGLQNDYSLKIPNEETRTFYKEVVTRWFKKVQGIDLLLVLKDLIEGDIKKFEKHFKKLAQANLSNFDVSGEPERFYHAFILGMAVQFQEHYRIKSNRESGYGRYDIALIPKNQRDHAIIIELKLAKEQEELTDAAKRALDQIDRREYSVEINGLGLDCLKIGIGFRKKQLEIVSNVDKCNK